MSAPPLLSCIGRNAWIVLRFVLFGFVGFWVMLYSAISFMIRVFEHRVFEHDTHFISPMLSLPLMVVGAFMMLYGVGEWRRWAYLWVFLSIPISLCLLALIPGTASDKGLPVLVAALAAFGALAGVRTYYASRGKDGKHEDDQNG